MFTGKLVFAQVMEHMPLKIFHRCVQTYKGNHKVKSFSCLDQYLCMAFAQLTYRESLRETEVCLRAQNKKLYQIVQEYWPEFQAELASHGKYLPAYVTKEFYEYLKCGIYELWVSPCSRNPNIAFGPIEVVVESIYGSLNALATSTWFSQALALD